MVQRGLSKVFYSETCNRQSFIESIFDIFKKPVLKATKVFVKPNIVSYETYPTTTHAEVLDTVLGQLKGHEIVVGDAPAIDAGRSDKILHKSPLRKVCEDHNVKLVNLYSGKMKAVKGPRGYSIRVSALPLACDYVISLPVLKVHHNVGLSGALKNQFGYLSRRDRLFMHCRVKSLRKGIVEVNAAIPTDLFIVDAVETMIRAQECRHGGCSASLGVMIAGTDPVSIDLFGLQLLTDLEPNYGEKNRKALEYVEYASSIGLGSKTFETEKI